MAPLATTATPIVCGLSVALVGQVVVAQQAAALCEVASLVLAAPVHLVVSAYQSVASPPAIGSHRPSLHPVTVPVDATIYQLV